MDIATALKSMRERRPKRSTVNCGGVVKASAVEVSVKVLTEQMQEPRTMANWDAAARILEVVALKRRSDS